MAWLAAKALSICGGEDSIANEFIKQVGVEKFEAWFKEAVKSDQCQTSLYAFARHFGWTVDVLVKNIEEQGLGEVYPVDRVKVRAPLFGVATMTEEQFLAKARAIGLTDGEVKSLASLGRPWDKNLKLSYEEAQTILQEATQLHEQFNLHELGLQLFAYFRTNSAVNGILGSEPGITDEKTSAFAILQLISESPIDFDFDKGVTKEAFEAVCQKHFGKTPASYKNSKITTLPYGQGVH